MSKITRLEMHGMSLECPASMAPHLVEVLHGEYDIPGLEFPTPPVILDAGANCGAFTVWAAKRWPGAKIIAYEPGTLASGFLTMNTALLRPRPELQQRAIKSGGDVVRLYRGRNNIGESALKRGGFQRDDYEEVAADDPLYVAQMWDFDVVKVDTEGCEVEIIRAILSVQRPTAIMYEWHSQEDARWLEAFMVSRGYEQQAQRPGDSGRGVHCWLKEKQP